MSETYWKQWKTKEDFKALQHNSVVVSIICCILLRLVYATCCNSAPSQDHLNVGNMWKGVVERTKQVGYFDRANTAPYIEIPSIDSLLRSRTVRPGQLLCQMLLC